MSVFQDQFTEAYDIAGQYPVKRAVILASVQRSGSSLLGHTLRNTGAYGVPLEYFNVQNLAHWRKRFDFVSVNQFLDQIERHRTTPNGIFAIKSHYFQLRNFGSIRDLKTRYGDCRFVRIIRRDKLGQAISRTVAQQTGVWISGQPKVGEAHYDFDRIAENLRVLGHQDHQWSLAFAATGTPFLTVAHEDLVRDPVQTIAQVSAFCEIDSVDITLPESQPIKPQSNAAKQEWSERFSSEFDEKSETILNGYSRPHDAFKDLYRWTKSVTARSGQDEFWYPSPNLV